MRALNRVIRHGFKTVPFETIIIGPNGVFESQEALAAIGSPSGDRRRETCSPINPTWIHAMRTPDFRPQTPSRLRLKQRRWGFQRFIHPSTGARWRRTENVLAYEGCGVAAKRWGVRRPGVARLLMRVAPQGGSA
ncbi:Deferrochelatase/peroxidase EfeB [Gossypium arboreum]|uniref:Deferrochelatase/peroxidase EfeB n=1 Tax=Gossypium arboreum TaxID=29729 RepID=A0A0B0P1N4_GOSAR|nr:Deferrochelatase/peroxidase EfeB [Gossypium arboreum]